MDLFFFIFDRLNTSGVKLILKALINQNCRWSQYPPVAPTSPPRNLSQEDSQHVFQSSQAKLGQCLAQQPFFLLQQHREASYGCGSQVPIIQKAAPYLRGSTERERKMGKQNQSNLPSAVQQTDSSLVHLDSSFSDLSDRSAWSDSGESLYFGFTWLFSALGASRGLPNCSKYRCKGLQQIPKGNQEKSLSLSYIDLDLCPPGTEGNSQCTTSRSHIPEIINCEVKKNKKKTEEVKEIQGK